MPANAIWNVDLYLRLFCCLVKYCVKFLPELFRSWVMLCLFETEGSGRKGNFVSFDRPVVWLPSHLTQKSLLNCFKSFTMAVHAHNQWHSAHSCRPLRTWWTPLCWLSSPPTSHPPSTAREARTSSTPASSGRWRYGPLLRVLRTEKARFFVFSLQVRRPLNIDLCLGDKLFGCCRPHFPPTSVCIAATRALPARYRLQKKKNCLLY